MLKKLLIKSKNTFPDTALSFSNIIIRQKKFRKNACPYKFLIKKFLQPKKYTFDTKRQHKRRKPWHQETALK